MRTFGTTSAQSCVGDKPKAAYEKRPSPGGFADYSIFMGALFKL
jgi:hypothetical protein